MNIIECRNKKNELELNIINLVKEYEKETGCRVYRLCISTFVAEQTGKHEAIGITATVEL